MLDLASTPRTDSAAGDVDIREKVRFLSDAMHYPGDETAVEIVETHFSWVFLTRTHAYKLKKPAQGDGFDFRSIDARLRNARAELHLNRRLAADVYLGIIALTQQPNGELRLAGDGASVDWLVKMRRLDTAWMLDARLARDCWHYAEIEAVSHRLAQFFTTRAKRINSPATGLARLRWELHRTLGAHRQISEPCLYSRAKWVVHSLAAFMVRHEALLRQRIAEGHVIDGHGDLRPEHVYVRGIPQIIDCLEFRADLRRLDPLSEIAFLALECNRLRLTPIASRLMWRYRRRSRDRIPAGLVDFYTALNSLIRSRLAIEHLAEPGTRGRQHWIDRSASYLTVAAQTCRHLAR
jgi:uncharacterized protein